MRLNLHPQGYEHFTIFKVSLDPSLIKEEFWPNKLNQPYLIGLSGEIHIECCNPLAFDITDVLCQLGKMVQTASHI